MTICNPRSTVTKITNKLFVLLVDSICNNSFSVPSEQNARRSLVLAWKRADQGTYLPIIMLPIYLQTLSFYRTSELCKLSWYL